VPSPDAREAAPPLPYAVLDLDGVLADVRHRLPLVRSKPKRWDDFFDAADADPVLPEGRATADRLAANHVIAYVSGRPERCRPATEKWLADNGFPAGAVYLRPDDDRRPARLVKVAVVRRLARERPVAVIVDDDVRVTAALREAGFAVVLADWMAEQPGLFDPYSPEAL
jgi:hypothetical protein